MHTPVQKTCKRRNAIIALMLVACLVVTSISAYFTDGDTATNVFTVGKVSIDLLEPNFVESEAINLTPDQEIRKDPQIKNDGINDAYVFLEVVVPYANVVTANDDGTVNPTDDTQLFSWSVNPGWTLVANSEQTENSTYTYVYAYTGDDAATMKALAAGNTTPALFDYVRFANVTENAGMENAEMEIIVNAYAIQTQNINDGEAGDVSVDGDNSGKTSPANVWAILENQLPSTDYTGEDTSTDDKVNIRVEGLGNITVQNPDGATVTYDSNTGVLAGASPMLSQKPAEVEDKTTYIEFTAGTFEANTSYAPGEYELEAYEVTKTRTKQPVAHENGYRCWWYAPHVGTGTGEIYGMETSLSDIPYQSSNYIVYSSVDGGHMTINGVAPINTIYYSRITFEDYILENAIYLAAFKQQLNTNEIWNVAKWNGAEYENVDCRDEIDAITDFTETYTETVTEVVTISQPSSSTEYVYLPGGTMKAEEGMTWAEWLASEYNTFGADTTTVWDANYNEIDLSSEIVAGESYGFAVIEDDPPEPDIIPAGTMIFKTDGVAYFYGEENEVTASYTGWDTDTYTSQSNVPWYSDGNYASITNVVIEDGVSPASTQYWFYQCEKLATAKIGLGVTSISDYAFSWCTALTSVTIPDSVTSIGDYAFRGCSGLTSVTFGENSQLTSIGKEAFRGCTSLTSVTIPNSVTSIGDRAFGGCTGLTGSITIPDSVTSVGSGAFGGCSGLTSVTIGSGVTSFDSSAFMNCTNLTSISVDSENAVYHSAGNCLIKTETKTLIAGCKNSVIPSDGSVTSIGDSAFYYRTGLTSINIPDSVTYIGNKAFQGCSGLTSITIPDSVTSIGNSAFGGCTGLTSVTFGENSQLITIGQFAFSSCTGLTSVTIPDSVTSIGDRAFGGCTGLTSVTIGEGVTSIGAYAFQSCTGLTSIEIPDSVTSIGEYAFDGCDGLTSVTIGSGLTNISQYTFAYCDGLTSIGPVGSGASVEISDSVRSISSNAFYGCTGLKSIAIPDSVTSIGNSAFYGCTGLTNITIPDSVTNIGNNAFGRCAGLTDVYYAGSAYQWSFIVIESNNTYLTGATIHYNNEDLSTDEEIIVIPAGTMIFKTDGVAYFYGEENEVTASYTGWDTDTYSAVSSIPWYSVRSNITSVIIENGVSPVSTKNWFFDCTGLSSVTVGSDVTSIGDGCFYGCTSLSSVTFEDNGRLASIGGYAFYNCAQLSSLEIPGSVTSIADCALWNCGLTSLTFEDTSTWYYTSYLTPTSGGTQIDVTDASAAATYLTDTYCDYCWYKTD